MGELVQVYHYDAFSTEANKGNPDSIVLDAENLTDLEMQEMAEKTGVSRYTVYRIIRN